MAQWLKAFATKPDDLCSIPGAHMGKEKTIFCKLSFDIYSHANAAPINNIF